MRKCYANNYNSTSTKNARPTVRWSSSQRETEGHTYHPVGESLSKSSSIVTVLVLDVRCPCPSTTSSYVGLPIMRSWLTSQCGRVSDSSQCLPFLVSLCVLDSDCQVACSIFRLLFLLLCVCPFQNSVSGESLPVFMPPVHHCSPWPGSNSSSCPCLHYDMECRLTNHPYH